jgi:hypothetical protein
MQLRTNRAGFTVKTVISGRARSSCARRHTSGAALLIFLVAGAAHAGAAPGIVPDGGTHTSVTTSSSGRQTVSIAPSTYGVSSNTYSSFNITRAGATLDNTSANARIRQSSHEHEPKPDRRRCHRARLTGERGAGQSERHFDRLRFAAGAPVIGVTAGTQGLNVGGNVYSYNGNLTVTAPIVTARGIPGYAQGARASCRGEGHGTGCDRAC